MDHDWKMVTRSGDPIVDSYARFGFQDFKCHRCGLHVRGFSASYPPNEENVSMDCDEVIIAKVQETGERVTLTFPYSKAELDLL